VAELSQIKVRWSRSSGRRPRGSATSSFKARSRSKSSHAVSHAMITARAILSQVEPQVSP
jgi:hypothetical protein